MKSSAPALIPATLSSLPLAVTITIGRKLVAGSARSLRQTSNPSIPGIDTSNSTMSIGRDATRSSASAPDIAVTTV